MQKYWRAKNCIGSFSSNVEDNIDKTCKKVGSIFTSHFDRRKANPLIYIKFLETGMLTI